jgi:hypothetical protein
MTGAMVRLKAMKTGRAIVASRGGLARVRV